jgi:hypothetical protein
MTDRRRTPRYVLGAPLRGVAMPMLDVTVEQVSGDRLVVISPATHPADEELMIHMRTADGLRSYQARVVSSSPVSVGGTVCFRVELRVADERPSRHGENLQ